MEKQGMGRGRRFLRPGLLIRGEGYIPRPNLWFDFRAGLLIVLLAFLPGGFLFSQADGRGDGTARGAGASLPEELNSGPLEIRTESSPANPVVNTLWSVFILVNHPWPQEVNVKPPEFPPSMVLERVRTETRSIQGDRWTRVEFLFTPRAAGAVTLKPFEVAIPGRQAVTGEINVRFREEARTVRRYDPRFRWISQNPSGRTGEPGELVLELSNWDPQKNPPEGIFRGRTPLEAILEESEPVAVREGIFRYTISIIPLEGAEVALGPFSLQAEDYTLNLPGITVVVEEAAEDTTAGSLLAEEEPPESLWMDNFRVESFLPEDLPTERLPTEKFPTEKFPTEDHPTYPFSPERGKIFPLFRADYNRIIAGVQALWDKGRRVEALAEIRRNERDSLSGPFLAPLRRGMEQAVGLGFTDDERWRPLKIPLVSWVLLGLLVLFAGVSLFIFRPGPGIRRKDFRKKVFRLNNVPEKTVTSRRRGGFRTVIVLVLSIGLVVIFLEEGLGNFMINRLSPSGKTAVLERTTAYRVPDPKGAVNARFDEGQPVIVGDCQGDWYYAESTDGRSGWVKREAVITY